MNMFEEFLNKDMDVRKPAYKIGDVVIARNDILNMEKTCIVQESVKVDDGTSVSYEYLIVDFDAPYSGCYTCEESMLTLGYHDTNWEEYFTETVGNGLPAWRGELYNCYVAIDDKDDYNNDTIPTDYMYHILNDHSVAKRFGDIIQDKKCYDEIQQTLKLSNKRKVENFRDDLIKKLIAYDKLDTDIHHPRRLAKQSNTKFTNEEEAFIKIIDKYDPKDLYPYQMTSLQIMHAIKEAYANAYKIERTKGQIGEDRRTGEHYAPNKGQRKYRGESKTYNMTIEFWFDLDMKIITTAYPVEFHGIKSKKKNKE